MELNLNNFSRKVRTYSSLVHQTKEGTQSRAVFCLVCVIESQNLPNANGVGSRQRLSLCGANDGLCPSRQTCRFASANPVQPVLLPAPTKKRSNAPLFLLVWRWFRRICPTPTALVAGNVCRFAEQMTDFVRQGKLADSLQRILFNLSCYPHQQKTHFCLPTKVRFLNDVCLRQMMLACANDDGYA